MDGNTVVDGILASCYASVDYNLAHIGMLPLRWFPTMMELLFGKENDNALYLNFAKEFSRFLLPYGK